MFQKPGGRPFTLRRFGRSGLAPKTAKRWILLAALVAALAGTFLTVRVVLYPFTQVSIYLEEESFGGYTLFAPGVDDLGFERETSNTIYLIDMRGEIVHTWNVLDGVQLPKMTQEGNLVYSTRDRQFVKRAGIRKLDATANVLWYFQCWADHDFSLLENGNLLVHYIEDIDEPTIGPGKIRCPRIVEVNDAKEILWEWRAEDHLAELTELAGIQFPLDREGWRLFDWAHNNTCRVIGENDAALDDTRFSPGNILISYCNLNTIAVIDKESADIVWAWGPGELDGQHNPRMMLNGHIMIFDNGTERGYSRVLELDPLTGKIVWEYNDRGAEQRFYSAFLSSAQPLPNDNVLVCQSVWKRNDPVGLWYRVFAKVLGHEPMSTRLFEVNRQGKIVWECLVTAHGRGMQGAYQATRYSASELQPLFDELAALKSEETRHLRSLPYLR